jgi:hypothetical protein
MTKYLVRGGAGFIRPSIEEERPHIGEYVRVLTIFNRRRTIKYEMFVLQ